MEGHPFNRHLIESGVIYVALSDSLFDIKTMTPSPGLLILDSSTQSKAPLLHFLLYIFHFMYPSLALDLS